MLVNTIDQPHYLYIRSAICLLYKCQKSHLPTLSDHRIDGQQPIFIQAYNKVVGEHKQNNDGSESIWNYRLIISILQLPNDKTG